MQQVIRRRGARAKQGRTSTGDPHVSLLYSACGTVQAELVYQHGDVLRDYDQNELPPLLEACLSKEQILELEQAILVLMNLSLVPGSAFPRINLVQAFAVHLQNRETWDLKRLELVFCNTVETLEGSELAKQIMLLPEEPESEEPDPDNILITAVSCDLFARFKRLKSDLVILAGECASILNRVRNTTTLKRAQYEA